MPGSHDCGADAAAYVLGALEPAELERFSSHLETCAICQEEVASLRQLTDTLPLAAPQYEAPRSLRRKLMAEVRADLRAHEVAGQRARPTNPTSATHPTRPRSRRPALAAALGVVIAALAFAGIELSSSGGTRVYAASVGDAQVRITGSHGELVVHKLPEPVGGHIYEVWLERGSDKPLYTGALFSVTSTGDGYTDVPGNMHGVTAVMVTEERAGGTRKPTAKPVIVALI